MPSGDLSTVFGFKYVDGTMVYKLTKITSLDGVEGFKKHVSELGLDLRIDDRIDPPSECSLYRPISWNGRQIGNRVGAALCPLSFPLYELQAPMVKILLMLC